MKIAGHDIGVCSWSLKPRDIGELAEQVKELGLEHVQLALGPLVAMDKAQRDQQLRVLRDSGLVLTSGMIGFRGEDYSSISAIRETGGFLPDADWPQRREITLAAGRLARELKLTMVSLHLGFIPPSSHQGYATMLQRTNEVAGEFAGMDLGILLETGQESASELLQFLNDLHADNVYVNFDPANMILYGAGDPVQAVGVLARHIRGVHIKDGVLSDQPGIRFGEEKPFGEGQVPPAGFLRALKEARYDGPLVIEREGGDNRMGDVRKAVQTLQRAAESMGA